jgi:hypothetical protein
MAKTIRYQKTVRMEPRDGQKFATTYYKQTLAQRQELVKFLTECATEIVNYLDTDPFMMVWAIEQGQRGFPKTTGGNRTVWEIVEDIMAEAHGKTRQGLPKDFAQAPIDRWNKLFRGTDYEFEMIQTFGAASTTFDTLMEMQ